MRLSKTHTFIRFFKCYELFALGKLSMSLKLSSRHTRAYSRTFAFRNTQSVPLSAISNSNENVRLRACGRATTEERERERPNEGTNKRIVWLLLKLAIFNSVAGISNNLSREESLPEVYLHISSSPYLYCYDFIPCLFQAAQRAAGVCFCY